MAVIISVVQSQKERIQRNSITDLKVILSMIMVVIPLQQSLFFTTELLSIKQTFHMTETSPPNNKTPTTIMKEHSKFQVNLLFAAQLIYTLINLHNDQISAALDH
jgi:hypothetical protein